MVSFRDEKSQLGPSRLHDRERWRQVRGHEHCVEGSEGPQGTLSGINGSRTRLSGTWNSGRFEAQGHRVRKEQQRSEEHTSELQSRSDLVCRLLLEKKNKMTSVCCPHPAQRS